MRKLTKREYVVSKQLFKWLVEQKGMPTYFAKNEIKDMLNTYPIAWIESQMQQCGDLELMKKRLKLKLSRNGIPNQRPQNPPV